MTRTPARAALCSLSLMVLMTAAAPLHAQTADSSFAWYANLVSFDPTVPAVTVRARAEPHVVRHVREFAPGEEVVVFWSQHAGEADIVRYVAPIDRVVAETGYVLRASHVASDNLDDSVAFTVPVANDVRSELAPAAAGTPLRFQSSMALASGHAPLSVALAEVPRPRPEPVVKPVTWDGVNIAGTWDLATVDFPGNPLPMECTVTQAASELGGSCSAPPPVGTLELQGTVENRYVLFKMEPEIGMPWPVLMVHTGELGSDGTEIAGERELMGDRTPFTMTRR